MMYNDLYELIEYIHEKGLAIGMITDGLRLAKMDLDFTKWLTWLRISLSGVDFGLSMGYYDLNPD